MNECTRPSNNPPLMIWGKTEWYNPIDKISYHADIYHKIWKSPNNKYYPMGLGTIYHNIESGNDYILEESGWRIVSIAKKISIIKEK